MQTLQFTRVLQRIVAELKANELVEFLAPFLVRGQATNIGQDVKNEFSSLLFQSRVGFAELTKDSDATKILKALKIDEVYAPPRLGRILAVFSNQSSSQGIWGTENFADFFSFREMLSWLLKLSNACLQILEIEKVGEDTPAAEIVEVELVDYDGTGVEADRVNQLFSSLTELHSHLARVFGIADAHLKILYLDSGSNLLVGIQASASIAETVRALFKELWDKIKYRRFEDFDRKVESLSKGLTLTATIQEQIEKKVIDEETGKNLKYRVLSEITTLIGIGAMLPPDEISEKVDRRKLLAEKRGVKLLGSGETPRPNDGLTHG